MWHVGPAVKRSWSLRRPFVTAARLTPSVRATSAFVIPPATIAAHRAQRSGPGWRFGSGATFSARPRRSRG